MDAEPESFGQHVTVKAAPGKIPSSSTDLRLAQIRT